MGMVMARARARAMQRAMEGVEGPDASEKEASYSL